MEIQNQSQSGFWPGERNAGVGNRDAGIAPAKRRPCRKPTMWPR